MINHDFWRSEAKYLSSARRDTVVDKQMSFWACNQPETAIRFQAGRYPGSVVDLGAMAPAPEDISRSRPASLKYSIAVGITMG